MEIAKQNKGKGIVDSFDEWPFEPRKVCYSVIETQLPNHGVQRKCDATGEMVRAPGDLMESESFWKNLGQNCKAAGFSALEVKLGNAASTDGRKRFMNCADLMVLSAGRDQLAHSGVR